MMPHFRWQSADGWWQSATEAVQRLIREERVNPECIQACSVSGRAGAGVFLDADGDVLYDPWLDGRHQAQLKQMQDAFPEVPLYAATLIAKLLWIREMGPGCF